MKKYLLILAMAMTVVACSDDEGSGPMEVMSKPNCLIEANLIEGAHAYTLDDVDLGLFKNEPNYFDKDARKQYSEYFDSIASNISHKPMDYKNMRLLFHISQDEHKTNVTADIDSEGRAEYAKLMEQIAGQVWLDENETETLLKNWQKAGHTRVVNKPMFYMARFYDQVTITADKALFGQPASTNLSKHFYGEGCNLCLPQGSLTDYTFLYRYDSPEHSMPVVEYFPDGSWLQRCYAFGLCDMPEERYDEVTFNITLPIVCEDWCDYYCHNRAELPTTQRTLTASCTVKLGQLSDFEQNILHYKAENSQLSWQ